MKFNHLILIISLAILFLAFNKKEEAQNNKTIFFLHNRFLEENDLNIEHPLYGKAEYLEIIDKFKQAGFQVISEKRKGNVNVRDYAHKVKAQIDSLIAQNIKPNNITVIGTSKGGYIAQFVSTYANNPELNFVFIGSYRDSDMKNIPEINYCGNILTIYEKTDPLGVSAIKRKESSTCQISHFKEIELNTELKHGFLFKALDQWIKPSINWANGNYN